MCVCVKERKEKVKDWWSTCREVYHSDSHSKDNCTLEHTSSLSNFQWAHDFASRPRLLIHNPGKLKVPEMPSWSNKHSHRPKSQSPHRVLPTFYTLQRDILFWKAQQWVIQFTKVNRKVSSTTILQEEFFRERWATTLSSRKGSQIRTPLSSAFFKGKIFKKKNSVIYLSSCCSKPVYDPFWSVTQNNCILRNVSK